jgi:hypothetical protein
MVYYPPKTFIPEKICVVRSSNNGIKFSSEISCPPLDTVCIIDNIFSGPFSISGIKQTNSGVFYADLKIDNAVNCIATGVEHSFAELRHWSLNELILEGLVGKGGNIEDGTQFVAVTYSGQYSTMIIKGGAIYREIKFWKKEA